MAAKGKVMGAGGKKPLTTREKTKLYERGIDPNTMQPLESKTEDPAPEQEAEESPAIRGSTDAVLDNMAHDFLVRAAREELHLGKNEVWLKKAFAETVDRSGMRTHKFRDGTGTYVEPYVLARVVVAYYFKEIVPYLSSDAEVIPTFADFVTFRGILVDLDRMWRRRNLLRKTHEDVAKTSHEYGLRWKDTPRHPAANGGTDED
jgi:hypothetical protein